MRAGWLRWDATTTHPAGPSGPRLLRDLETIARAEHGHIAALVRAAASRWGPLTWCAACKGPHPLRWPFGPLRAAAGTAESVAQWRRVGRAVCAVRALGDELRAGGVGATEDWSALGLAAPGSAQAGFTIAAVAEEDLPPGLTDGERARWLAGETVRAAQPTLDVLTTPAERRALFASLLARAASEHHVAPELAVVDGWHPSQRARQPWSFRLATPGMMAATAVALLRSVGRASTEAFCEECGRPWPRKKVIVGRFVCPRCRNRLRMARARAEQREANHATQ